MTDYRKIYAMRKSREDRIEKLCPGIPYRSGIYVFYRYDENGFKHCYCGQAVSLRQRCGSHLAEYDHIGLSLKKRGLYSNENPYGWRLIYKECCRGKLNENEQITIKAYADKGFQLYNVTTGSQGVGKSQLKEYKPAKGYHDGLKQGYVNASREISNLFEKHLDFTTKNTIPNKNQLKAVDKFNDFLNACKRGKEDG